MVAANQPTRLSSLASVNLKNTRLARAVNRQDKRLTDSSTGYEMLILNASVKSNYNKNSTCRL